MKRKMHFLRATIFLSLLAAPTVQSQPFSFSDDEVKNSPVIKLVSGDNGNNYVLRANCDVNGKGTLFVQAFSNDNSGPLRYAQIDTGAYFQSQSGQGCFPDGMNNYDFQLMQGQLWLSAPVNISKPDGNIETRIHVWRIQSDEHSITARLFFQTEPEDIEKIYKASAIALDSTNKKLYLRASIVEEVSGSLYRKAKGRLFTGDLVPEHEHSLSFPLILFSHSRPDISVSSSGLFINTDSAEKGPRVLALSSFFILDSMYYAEYFKLNPEGVLNKESITGNEDDENGITLPPSGLATNAREYSYDTSQGLLYNRADFPAFVQISACKLFTPFTNDFCIFSEKIYTNDASGFYTITHNNKEIIASGEKSILTFSLPHDGKLKQAVHFTLDESNYPAMVFNGKNLPAFSHPASDAFYRAYWDRNSRNIKIMKISRDGNVIDEAFWTAPEGVNYGKSGESEDSLKGVFDNETRMQLNHNTIVLTIKNQIYLIQIEDKEAIKSLVAIQQIDGNLIPEKDRMQPHRITWEVKDKNNHRIAESSGYLDIDASDPTMTAPWEWPLLVSETINKQNGFLKAGVKQQENGKIIPGAPVASQYKNWLWLAEDKASEGYNVSLDVELLNEAPESAWQLNPEDQKAFTSVEGDSFVGKTVIFSVTREGNTQEYPIVTHKKDRFMAMKDISSQVNERIPDIRLGEKVSGNTINPLSSQYRNKIWVKNGDDGKPSASVLWRVK
ncbi:hypothetical protein OQ483_23900 (plasmid) [Enterobacter bugandensis]|uniref:hypothetical protein n=1 Tax=Enterobacter bugandensis TaxID=881260 RepID=UPI00283AA14E|nr:hypothetical protein [Enterobacter bugandensis]WMU75433.1 hypothetical protein OQ483_23900 [Enterobacter bugandensis]